MRCTAVFALCAASLLAEAPANIPPDLRFEVASLKRSKLPVDPRALTGIRPAPGGERYEAFNCPIRLMIQVAFRVKAEQIVGEPGWLDNDLFDMEAKAEKSSSVDELHVMLMNMLVDRLHLKFHREKKGLVWGICGWIQSSLTVSAR